MKLRIARHTNRLNELIDFYANVIGLTLPGEFKDHSGYDGAFLGDKNKDWHLEFTQSKTEVNHTFDEDDILVFYPEPQSQFDLLLARINKRKIIKLTPKNPYWEENGITINDPDGYKIVIKRSSMLVRE